jgi:1-acyl-sn-glycerol-3-phosphate acyltransferase
MLRQAGTFLAVVAAMAAFLAEGVFLRLAVADPVRRRWLRIRRIESYARAVSGVLDLRVTVDGNLSPVLYRRLLVANHMSYLDAVVACAALPVCFVSSKDMRRQPVLGWILEAGGCLFVERRKAVSIRGDVAKVTAALRDGFDVMVFPEATSTPGEAVLPFRPALFSAAVDASAVVQPVRLRYESIDGKPVGPENRDLVCWYGDMTFLPHLWKLAGCRAVKARLTVLEPLSARGADPRELAQASHAAISGGTRVPSRA